MSDSQTERFSKQLKGFIPEDAVQVIASWIVSHNIDLRITRSRKSVFGDYRWPQQGRGHRITVNGDLNPYAFLITLVHEMAHLITWEKFKNEVPSHGKAWKQEFRNLMDEFSGKKLFPVTVHTAFKNHLVHPQYTHCEDPELMRALRRYDKVISKQLSELKKNDLFEFGRGRIFRKGERLRKRFQCYEVKTNRIYLFSPAAEVREFSKERY